MQKKSSQNIFLAVAVIILISASLFMSFGFAHAQIKSSITNSLNIAQKYVGIKATGTEGTNINKVIGNVIQIILSILTIYFFALFIYNGYLWMSAAGNDEQVKKAQRGLRNALIGLVIVLMGFGITYMILSVLEAQVMLL